MVKKHWALCTAFSGINTPSTAERIASKANRIVQKIFFSTMDGDQIETELIKKISELEQEAKEHQLVLDAFESVEPSRKCFRMIGGVLVERTVQDIKPSLEENLLNV